MSAFLPYSTIVPPAGITAASLWAPAVFVDPAFPAANAADRIDPTTGEYASVLGGRNAVDAALLTQLRTLRATGAAVLEQGQAFDKIKKNDAAAPASIKFEIDRIFRPFIAANLVKILSTTIEAGEDAEDVGAALIVYRNLQTRSDLRLGLSSDGAVTILGEAT